MTDPTCTADARPTGAPAQSPNCSRKQEQRGLPVAMGRMMGLEVAADMLGGKAQLAGAMAITIRALNFKLNAERGISNIDMSFAAKALDARAKALTDHAAKLRAEIAASQVAR